jgi:tRNA-2-methylthio-N6-dimethylallyladenosine synthase
MNKSDSERVAAYLEENGFLPALSDEEAGLVMINTCGVRQSAESRIYGLVGKIRKKNKNAKIVITGCLSEREDLHKKIKNQVDLFLPIIDLPKLSEKLNIKKEKTDYKNYLNIAPKYKSKFSAFVPIGNGCDNFCSYCVVPYARGREVYRPRKEIISEVKNLIKKGYKEITLIAQNVNSYKVFVTKNKKSQIFDFSDLLAEINKIKGDFWIRFATSHPKDMSNKLIKTIAEGDKICKHIHLPAQSGDNEILKKMNRGYSREKYLALIKNLKNKIEKKNKDDIDNIFSASTDIIVGFPGETKKQFNNTKKLFKEIEFDMAYVSQYSPRPGTVALKFKDNIKKEEKKRREEELMKILRKSALRNSNKFLNKDVLVLFEGKTKKNEYYGKTRSNKTVKVKEGDNSIIGNFLRVKIKKAYDFGMDGELLKNNFLKYDKK